MVGVPRSRGCLLCVQRRVRCDEGRPGCAKCATYGAECPGYDRSLKFVTGKHQVRRRGKAGYDSGSASSAEARQSGHRKPSPEITIALPERPGLGFDSSTDSALSSVIPGAASSALSSRRGHGLMPLESTPPAAPILPHLQDCRATYVNAILHMIDLDHPSQESLFYGTWFYQVPNRLGHKVTLDSAVCSFAMHLLGKSRGDDNLVAQSRKLYGQSLVALQKALDHPVEWRSSETLCTTMVMCLFELFADTSGLSEGWLQHAGAVAYLMQQRGADGFVEPWDRSMLFSFSSIISMNALFTGQDCFLEKKKWQRVLSNMAGIDTPILNIFPPEATPVINSSVLHLARLPGVMRLGWTIRETRIHGLPVDPVQVSVLCRKASNLHATIRAWFSKAEKFLGDPIYVEVPSNVPEDAPASPYPTVLAYPNPWVASVYLMYVTTTLIVQECLNQCAEVRAEASREEAVARATVGSALTSSTNAETPAAALSSSHNEQGTLSSPSDDHSLSASDPEIQAPEAALSAVPTAPETRPYDKSNRLLCHIIYRSFETLGHGIVGQYRIGFFMRVSYEFADVPTQLWIRSLLDRSVKTFASSRSETYPSPKPNEYNYN